MSLVEGCEQAWMEFPSRIRFHSEASTGSSGRFTEDSNQLCVPSRYLTKQSLWHKTRNPPGLEQRYGREFSKDIRPALIYLVDLF